MGYLIKKLYLTILIVCCSLSSSEGQSNFYLELDGEQEALTTISDYDIQKEFSDSLSFYLYLKELLGKLRADSYLEASFDEIVTVDSIFKVFFHLGPQYQIAQIKAGNIDESFLDKIGFREKSFENKKLRPETVSTLMSDILGVFENNGYPFANIALQERSLKEGTLNASLYVNKGKLFYFDQFNLIGDAEISNKYLQHYLDIKEGTPYNHSKVLEVREIIRSNRFLQLNANPTITFKADKAILNLDLTKKKSSRFDFLLGILPQSNDGETSITITGELTTDLYNKLGKGEHFYLEFKRLRPETQELELAFNYPYLLDLPFGIDTKFDLFRNANDFLEINFNAGLQYLFTGVDYLKFFLDFNSIKLLDIDTSQIKIQGKLPNQLDINYNSGGLEFNLEKLDYKFNPRKGLHAIISGAAGFKKIVRNNEILAIKDSDIDFETLYDELKESSFQFNILSDLSYFIPIMKRATLLTRIRSGMKISGEEVFENEFYRLGGNKLLRGFDEESVLAKFYTVFTAEYRLLISQNSFISVFFDYGIVKNDFREEMVWDNPFGFGAGINFETSAGIFGLSAALGSQLDNPINFRDMKVHFGYISLF